MSINVKAVATEVATIAASVGAVLAVVLNVAPSAHLPAQDVAYVVAATSVVGAIAAEARKVAGVKVAARRDAKASKA